MKMNEKMKKKYDELKYKTKITSIEKSWKNNILLQECIEFTSGIVLPYDHGNKIVEEMQSKIPFSNGKVDFSKFKYKNNLRMISTINESINNSQEFYVVWNETNLPCLKIKLENIIKFIDDITCVSFDTWLVSLDYNTIIELHHEGDITLGILF